MRTSLRGPQHEAALFFLSVRHMKPTSKEGNQLELLPSAGLNPVVEEVTPILIERVRRLPTLLAAWNYAQQLAAVDDKALASFVKVDKSHWTKIGQGRASPPADERFIRYMDALKSEVPLIWLAEARGYDFLSMQKHQNDVERENARLRQENADLRRAFNLAYGVSQERR